MKKILSATMVVFFGLVGVASAGATKVDICHFTGSEGNPFEIITISDAAYDSHIAHGDSDVNDDGSCGEDNGGGGPS